jgi:hypothetical protein
MSVTDTGSGGVSQPANLRLMVEHPMPTSDHGALLASYRLLIEHADACLDVQVLPTATTSCCIAQRAAAARVETPIFP